MEKYKFYDHTADAKFRAFGNTLEEAFSHAALAVASLMWDWEKIALKSRISINVEGKDLAQLLVNFLEEILYLLDTRHFLLGSADDISIQHKDKGWLLHASFKGDVRTSEYEIHGDVKAITYNEMDICDRPPYVVQVVADI
jgi:SHS2 domain-containing protein